MENSLKRIESTYDKLAKSWAAEFADEHDKKPKDKEMLRLFASEIGDRTPVWDLGCGPGCTSAYLNSLRINVSGLDLSSKLLEEARSQNPQIHFEQGNMLDMFFDDNAIAGLVSFYGIIHCSREEVGRFFCEAFRVLQPGGLFLFTYHVGVESIVLNEFLGHAVDINFEFFTTDFITDTLQTSGFEQIAVLEREPYPGVEYPSRRAYVFARKVAEN